jgi:hypothetical protein
MPGWSIYCANCNSRAEPKCNDPFDLTTSAYVNCSSDYFKKLIDGAAGDFTEVQDAFLAYTTVEHGDTTCQKLVVKGKSCR